MPMLPVASRWLPLHRPSPSATLRLFCFPYAGGGAHIYGRWAASLPSLEICAVQPPGRWNRISEPLITNVRTLVEAMLVGFGEQLRGRFAFYGHSVGAVVAFELARLAQARGLPSPVWLFVAARRAPHIVVDGPDVGALDDDQLVRFVSEDFGSFPRGLMLDDEIRRLLLPILRADLMLDQRYVFEPTAPLACPVTVIGGYRDRSLAPEWLDAWQAHAATEFDREMVDGGHLFLHTHHQQLARIISQRLQ